MAQPNPAAQPLNQAAPWLETLPNWAEAALIIAAPAAALLIAQLFLFAVLRRLTRAEGKVQTRRLVNRTNRPAQLLAIILGTVIGTTTASLRELIPSASDAFWDETLRVLGILSFTWLLIGFISGADDMILARYRVDVRDNLKARRMHTQVRVISRCVMVIIAIVGASIALMTFEEVEQIGQSLLASAGIAGIVIGFAARPVLGNLIAGIQIALTQPIRIDDAVIIEGEWGWIEEITTTYVVVKIWDQRRLIVPFSSIIEKPFQNWTRNSADIIGTVVLHLDYTVPVEEVRAELKRVVENNERWDKRVCVLQVIDTTERTQTLRALVSAGDSPTCWDLRCETREALVTWVAKTYPNALPRFRAELPEANRSAHAASDTPPDANQPNQ